MREFLTRIFKSAIENWLVSLLTAAGVAIGGSLLWLYRTYLQDWFLSTRYVEMPGWAWVLIVLGISTVPALLVFWIITQRRKKVLTDEKDIKNVLREWFNRQYNGQWADPEMAHVILNYHNIDQRLNLPSGSSKHFLVDIVNQSECRRIIKDGEDTFEIGQISY